MARQRFLAPARAEVSAETFDHPIFAGCAPYRDLLHASAWPGIDCLNDRLARSDLCFVTQDEALLRDGLHYEARIRDQGRIATREHNWHDLFNALIWLQYAPIKHALNLRQAADLDRHGPRQRSRAQCALTHFDEAGVVVWAEDAALLAAWDAHDWRAWFGQHPAFSAGRLRLHVFGHALLEHALRPDHLPTAKALVLCGGDPERWCERTAEAIAQGRCLRDPQELRPLPLLGWPGFCDARDTPGFWQRDPFRPLRAGRTYPAALAE